LEIQERSGGGAREIIPGFWQREIFFDLKATVLEEALEQLFQNLAPGDFL
jgi:hypothetical protein